MELLENYNKALNALLAHLKFNLGTEWVIMDCTVYYWHLVQDYVLYARDPNVDDDPYVSLLTPRKHYKVRVFGSKELTGIITGRLGREVLLLFDNDKYIGDPKKDRKYV